MELPPARPPTKPPLGASFYVILLTPLVLMAVSACLSVNRTGNFRSNLFMGGASATFVSSVILGIWLGRRLSKPGGSPTILGVLMFIGLQLFYGVCFFIGCTAAAVFS